MTSKTIKVKVKTQPSVVMEAEVARKIRQHARSSMKAEVCGVLLGSAEQDRTVIDACIAGINAAQGGAHVTFTQDTWEHIYKIKDQQFPDSKIVGWYHSHPGFGVFLSEHDLFIQENFFSSPQQVAWVYDPHTDEEGCFGWVGGSTEKLSSMRFGYSQSVEMNGSAEIDQDEEDDDARLGLQVRVGGDDHDREPVWIKWISRGMMYVALAGLGFILGYMFLARKWGPQLDRCEELVQAVQAIQQYQQHQQQYLQDQQMMPVPSAGAPAAGQAQSPTPSAPQKAPETKGKSGRH